MAKEYTTRFITLIIAIFLIAFYIRNIIISLPSIEDLRQYSPPSSTKIYDRNNEIITEYYTERRTWIPLSKIPVDLQNAILAIEDDRFFRHWGISYRGIVRATLQNVLKRKFVAGGSAITQQLAKLAFLNQRKTFDRKLKELLLAIQLERNFSKQEILEMYLNQVYMANGAYGVEQAANVFFSKHAQNLTLSECAILAGIVRYPNYYSPINNLPNAINRRTVVISRMRQLKFINQEEEKNAMKEPIRLNKTIVPSHIAPYFIEQVRLYIEQKYGQDAIYHYGWKIYTTVDIEMQNSAETVAQERMEEFDKEKGYTVALTSEKAQCALLAVDPINGQIRAMIGGRDFKESQFNRVTQARRQPGSAFKPIVYAAAIERGYTPATILEDTPLVYVNDGRDWQLKAKTTDYLATLDKKWIKDPMKVWVPENYKRKYHQYVLLRKALEFSLNVCAVRVIEEIGATTVIDYARRLGITSPLTNTFSLALGASDVTLLEMVRAFSVFAIRGIKTDPYFIVKIEDKDGRIIEENKSIEQDVLSPQTCYVLTNLLKGVVQHGTGQYARLLNRPCAGKTGTTNDFTDAWFIGYTPQLVCGVWIGYDNHKQLGNKMTGGAIACPIWTEFMKLALKMEPLKDFQIPSSGVTLTRIDSQTGLAASSESKNTYLEAFIAGTEPKLTSLNTGTTVIVTTPNEEEEGTGF